jgi:hypothetical protein
MTGLGLLGQVQGLQARQEQERQENWCFCNGSAAAKIAPAKAPNPCPSPFASNMSTANIQQLMRGYPVNGLEAGGVAAR